MVAAASTNGGTLNRVHAEFSNGYIFAVRRGQDYVPVTFSTEDIYGCSHTVLLASGSLYHKGLMRSDGGMYEKNDSVTPTFNWRQLEKVTVGHSQGPDGEIYPIYGYCLNEADRAAICGLKLTKKTRYRCDRTFWDVGGTVQNATGPADLFGLTQIDPRACMHNPCDNGCGEDTWASRTGCEEPEQACYNVTMEEDE